MEREGRKGEGERGKDRKREGGRRGREMESEGEKGRG